MDPDKLAKSDTTDGQPPRPGFERASAPAPINPSTGQHEAYWVLSDEERAKGFVRPVRDTYRHVGRRVCGKLVSLDVPLPAGKVAWICMLEPHGSEEECGHLAQSASASELERVYATGLFGGCGTTTSMGRKLAETYARDFRFYSQTFCVTCRGRFPVGESGEFVWADLDGGKVGT